MSLQNLNFGTAAPNDGEFLPTAFAKIQANFTEIYGVFGNGTVLSPAPPFALVVGASQGLGSIAVPASGTLLQGVAGANPVWTATPTLGVAGTTLGTLAFAGNTSGTTTLQPAAAASGILTLPATTDTLVGRNTTDTLSNKTLVAPALGTPASGVLSNCTGYPAANLTGLPLSGALGGTGIANTGFTLTLQGSSALSILSNPAAAVLQLGAADAAAPVAQTLQVQSASGAANVAGVDVTYKASAGTGTGVGGRYVWQLARAGGAGSAQNTFSNGMSLDISNGNYNLILGSGANGTSNLTITGNNGASWGDLQFFSDGGTTSKRAMIMGGDAVGICIAADWSFKFSSNASNAGDSLTTDTTLSRLSANCIKSAGAWASSAPNTQSGTSYSMVAADSSLIFSNTGIVTLTLLAASSNTGRWLYVKNTGTGGTLVSASSNVAPIGSAAAGTAILAAGPGKWAILESDGTNWIVIAAN